MWKCRSESGGALRWRYSLLLIGAGIALLFGQTESAHAAGFTATTGSMVTVRQNHTATLLNDGRVLITGGTSSGSPLNSAELYDPATGNFTATGNMSVARQNHTATRLADGRVLIAGGHSGSAYLATAEIFDPAGNGGAGAFTATGSMTVARTSHAATLVSGTKVLVAGGQNSDDLLLTAAEIFDPAGNSGAGAFTATGSMGTRRRLHTATLLLDGRVLITGGGITNSISSSSSNVTNSAEIYTPGAGTFAPVAALMTSNRREHTATLLTDGRVLIAGGIFSATSLASAEVFAPAGAGGAGTFTATGSMAGGHYDHTATRLPSGKVLIAGGNPSAFTLRTNTAQIFNPSAGGSFSSAGTMTAARAFHAAVSLNDGTVLLAGGNDTGVISDSAELYNPAAITATPSSFTFDDIFLGDPSAPPQVFTISNSGSSTLTLSPVAISPNQTNFQITANSCTSSLAAGGSCSVSVTFNPSTGGNKSAVLVITSNDPERPSLSVPLNGMAISLTPTAVVSVSLAGTGTGSVHSSPAGIACDGSPDATCQAEFDSGSPVTLTPTANSLTSLFSGWSCSTGDCSWLSACGGTGDCTIEALDFDVSAIATFNYVKPAKIAGTALFFDTLQSAYDSAVAGNGTVVQAREFTFAESPILNGNGSSMITINGGYDLTYSANSGNYSIVNGVLTIGTGRVTLSNMIIQ